METLYMHLAIFEHGFLLCLTINPIVNLICSLLIIIVDLSVCKFGLGKLYSVLRGFVCKSQVHTLTFIRGLEDGKYLCFQIIILFDIPNIHT